MEQSFQHTLSVLMAFLVLVWPGLLAVSIYHLIVPGRGMQWRSSSYRGLFFSVVNYIVLFPVVRFAWDFDQMTKAPMRYWICLLILFVVGPIALAVLWIWIRRLPWVVRFFQHPDPTPWDHYFDRREHKFMILHLNDGHMIGGYYGAGSYASSFPDQGDLYLSMLYEIDENGKFGNPVEDTDGLLIRKDQYTRIELFNSPE